MYISPALSCSKFLLSLSNDLLDYAQIEVGKFNLNLIEINLRHFLIDIQNLIKTKTESRGLDLILDIDKDIPITIKSDPNRLRQIIINLVGN